MARTLGIEELLNEAGWLRRLAASLVGDAAQADDLVQDTWVAALRRPPSSGRSPRPWLGRVVRNLARNARRDRTRREAREQDAGGARVDPGPEDLAQEAEAQRLLAEAVTRLSEPLRAVIVLRYFQGLDSVAAAARLGVPASTVRTRIQKALEELRAELDRRVEGGRQSWALLLTPLARDFTPSAIIPGSAAAAAVAVGSWPVVLAWAGGSCALLALGAVSWKAAEAQRTSATLSAAPVELASASSPRTATAAPATLSADERGAVDGREEQGAVNGAAQGSSAGAPRGTAEVSGTVLVDGRPPEWPIELSLQPLISGRGVLPAKAAASERDELKLKMLMEKDHVTALPEDGGAFTFGEVAAHWSGHLRVGAGGYAFEDGSTSLELDGPATGLVLHLRSGPAIVGRIRGPDGLAVPGLMGVYEFGIGDEGRDAHEVDISGFACDANGRFRIPSKARADWGALALLFEAEGLGYLHYEAPRFDPAVGLDLGDLELEPLRALEFTVRDPEGAPLKGAFARVGSPLAGVFAGLNGPWSQGMSRTDADGAGVLKPVPDRQVDVRFAAFGHADRVLRVDPRQPVEVVLERLAMLEIRLRGALRGRAAFVKVSAERSAFLWDERGWDQLDAELQLNLGGADRSRLRGVGIQPREYEFRTNSQASFVLPGLRHDVALAVEVLDEARLPLATDSISLAAGERAVLEFGEGELGGEAPAPAQELLLKIVKPGEF